MPTSVDLAWLAGIVDGEGCLTVKRPRIIIANTEDSIIDTCKKILKDFGIYFTISSSFPSRAKKVIYRVDVSRHVEVAALCILLHPYLKSVARLNKMDQMMRILENRRPRRMKRANLPVSV